MLAGDDDNTPLDIVVGLAAVGLVTWLLIRKRRQVVVTAQPPVQQPPHVVEKHSEREEGADERDKILVLFVSSNPHGTVPVKVDRELKIIREAIEMSRHRDRLELDTISAATLHDVRRALMERPYDVVHMSGHGEESGLILENADGKMDKIAPERLVELFSSKAYPKGELRCVVLNSCHSIATGEPLSKAVPFTVAMEGRLADVGAIEFSRGFYDALGAGLDYDKAFDEGVICRNVAAPTGNFVAKLLQREHPKPDAPAAVP